MRLTVLNISSSICVLPDAFLVSTEQLIALGHLIGEDHFKDPYTMTVVQSKLTKNMGELAPIVLDEMFAAFDDLGIQDGETTPQLRT